MEQYFAKFTDDQIDNIPFPEVKARPLFQGLRTHKRVEGYNAIVNASDDRVFSIVSEGYKLVDHREVLSKINDICVSMPEYGEPMREVWFSNYGGRMKTRWTFKDVDFEITPGDFVHPTLESFSSYDTTLAQKFMVGGFRVVCTNGMTVGKILSQYKRKHTASLDLDIARNLIKNGLINYSEAVGLWKNLANRKATLKEVCAFEELNFNASERIEVENEIKKIGNVVKWDVEEKEIDINAWDLMNIYTAEIEHRVPDITRRDKILEGLAKTFTRG
jgi:hypothetical protein